MTNFDERYSERIEALPESTYTDSNGVQRAMPVYGVKVALRNTRHYYNWAVNLGYDGEPPFTEQQFAWLTSDPVGPKKFSWILAIQHRFAKLADELYLKGGAHGA